MSSIELTFSQRMGYEETRADFQKESIDEKLTNALWNIILEFLLDKVTKKVVNEPGHKPTRYKKGEFHAASSSNYNIMEELWRDFFVLPVDTIPYSLNDSKDFVKELLF